MLRALGGGANSSFGSTGIVGMSPLEGIGWIVGLYLALLARSAWKQGELRQFATSLAVVMALGAVIAAAVAFYIWIDRG